MVASAVFSRVGLSMVASAALVFSIVTPVQAEPRVVVAEVFDPGLVLPGVESTAADAVKPTIPEGDFALWEADEFSVGTAAKEIVGKLDDSGPLDLTDVDLDELTVVGRDEFSTTYDGPGGLPVVELSESPLNVVVDGDWVEVDGDLELTPDGFVAEAHPLAPEFAATADEEIVTVTDGDVSLSWRLLGAEDADARLGWAKEGEPETLWYRDALEGVDLAYDVEPSLVKESMILEVAPVDAPVYEWVLTAPGLTVQPDDAGGFALTDADGVVRFSIPTPFMWDSSGVVGEREPETSLVAATVEPWGDEWLLTLSPDFAWLSDPERVFPVTVDPSAQWNASTRKSYKSDGTPQSGATQFGNPWQANQALYWRGYAQYPLGNIAGTYLIDSEVVLSYTTGTATCQTGYVGSGSSNPTSVDSYGSDISAFTLCNAGASASPFTIDGLDSTLAGWVRNGTYSNWLGFRSHWEANTGYSYKGANTSLIVVYAKAVPAD